MNTSEKAFRLTGVAIVLAALAWCRMASHCHGQESLITRSHTVRITRDGPMPGNSLGAQAFNAQEAAAAREREARRAAAEAAEVGIRAKQHESWMRALKMYPYLGVKDSAIRQLMDANLEIQRKTGGRPDADPDYPMKYAKQAAEQLGVKPRAPELATGLP